MPAGFAAGDLLVGFASGALGVVPSARPSGWSVLRTITDTNMTVDIVTKTAAGGDAAPSWTATSRKWSGACIAITGGTWNTGGAWDVENGAAQGTTSTTSYAAPSITTLTADCLLLAMFTNLAASTWTNTNTNPAMVEAVDTTASGTTPTSLSLYHSSLNVVPVGAITRNGTASVASADACMWAGAIKPTGTGGVGGIFDWYSRPHRHPTVPHRNN
jgi:hypothetical protein